MKKIRLLHSFGVFIMGILLGTIILFCEDHRNPLPGQVIQSNSPKTDWGPTITPPMLAIIEELVA